MWFPSLSLIQESHLVPSKKQMTYIVNIKYKSAIFIFVNQEIWNAKVLNIMMNKVAIYRNNINPQILISLSLIMNFTAFEWHWRWWQWSTTRWSQWCPQFITKTVKHTHIHGWSLHNIQIGPKVNSHINGVFAEKWPWSWTQKFSHKNSRLCTGSASWSVDGGEYGWCRGETICRIFWHNHYHLYPNIHHESYHSNYPPHLCLSPGLGYCHLLWWSGSVSGQSNLLQLYLR